MDASKQTVSPSAEFTIFPSVGGELARLDCDDRPFILLAWRGRRVELSGGATHFGFVESGRPTLTCESGEFRLTPGMYFSAVGAAALDGDGLGMVVSQLEHRGFFQLGGPIEATGRLRYIDGCSDSLLIGPIRQGDACLNLLHIPPGTNQTTHTHPSFRAGLVVRGRGVCRTADGETQMTPGAVFVIAAECRHSFHTLGEALTVVAFHPDSDWGPTDEFHPMLNRTYVDGVSASRRRGETP
ncbi:MAG: cupin domain-containing protein [Pirellulaceae bacterium]